MTTRIPCPIQILILGIYIIAVAIALAYSTELFTLFLVGGGVMLLVDLGLHALPKLFRRK